MSAGLTLAEREELRARYREAAIAEAALMGMTIRCRNLQHDLADSGHRMCQGERPGNSGCLCRCHDVSAVAQVLSREDSP